MKRIFILVFIFIISNFPIIAQDENDRIGQYTDLQFNNDKDALFVNNTFIKSPIGINVENLMNNAYGVISVSKQNCNPPLVINGVQYDRKIIITCTNEPEFVTLQEIREQYCPSATGSVIYMINKFFITKDVESYRIDNDFIKNCETLPSSEFELFKDFPPFTIVRIFTKTKGNTYPLRLR